jgi:hypothetical protein
MRPNPYEASNSDVAPLRDERRWPTLVWSAVTVFGTSFATLSLLSAAVWDGTITVYEFGHQSHIFTAAISLGLATVSALCLYASLSFSRPHLRVSLLLVISAVVIGLLLLAEWPIAVYYVYFDLSNLIAIHVATGLVPTLLLASVPPRSRKPWNAVIPYGILIGMAIYLLIRPS